MDKRIQLVLNLVISLIVFAAILYLVGIDKISTVLLKARWELLGLGVVAYGLLNIVMSYRIKIVLESIGDKIPLKRIIPSNLAGMLASDFTPARAGYFFTAFSISSRENIGLEKTMLSIFGPQMFDFIIKVLSAGILLLLILSQTGMNNIVVNAALLVAFLSAILFASALVFHPPLLKRFGFFESFPLAPRVFAFLRKMHLHSDKVLALKEKIVAITLLSWFMKGLEWYLLSQAIGIQLSGNIAQDILFIMVFQGAITIIQFLPIPTLAGAGASEAGFAGILAFFGVPLEVAVTFGFLTRLVMIIVDMFSVSVILDYLHTHSLEKSLEGISGVH